MSGEALRTPLPPGGLNGVLVDSGSRDIVLHSDECEPCGGKRLSAVQDTNGAREKSDAAQPDTAVIRTLADGKEWMRSRCGVIHAFNGKEWHALYPKGQGRSECSPFYAIIHRAPHAGYERVSTSRSGTFGIAPGSVWAQPFAMKVDGTLRDVIATRHDVCIGTMHMACAYDNSQDFARDVARLVRPCATRLCYLPPYDRASAYSSSYTCGLESLAIGDKRVEVDTSNVKMVVDTGSSMLFIPHTWWALLKLDDARQHTLHIGLRCEHAPQDVAALYHGCMSAVERGPGTRRECTPFVMNVPVRNASAIPKHLPVPENMWLVGAKALSGNVLVFHPGDRHTGKGSHLCIAA